MTSIDISISTNDPLLLFMSARTRYLYTALKSVLGKDISRCLSAGIITCLN